MSANKSFPRSCSCHHHFNSHCCFLIIFIQLFLPFAHSVSFDITSFDSTANNIVYEGDASPETGNIELNSVDYLCRVGRAIYSEPIRIWDASKMSLADFTTQFSFQINTRNATTYGNGFAFFLAPVDYQLPPNSAGGYLGLLNSSTFPSTSRTQIVSVEFDSYVNNDWDPPTEHVGINNNSLASAVYAPWNAGSNSQKTGHAWITYNATTTNLSVFWTYDEHPVFMGNSSLSYVIDLMKTLPEWVKIGFSAGTGQYTEYNTIKSWNFTSNFVAKGVVKPPGNTNKNNKIRKYVIVLVPVCAVVLLLGLLIGFCLVWRKRPIVDENSDANGTTHGVGIPEIFSYQQLFDATNGFADDRRLGGGGSAQVYKGELGDHSMISRLKCITLRRRRTKNRVVAVKRLYANFESFYENELNVITRLKNPNLVSFIGYCHEGEQVLLVYEYMPNGCLDSHLHGDKPTLPWNTRYKIAIEVASALYYLHEGEEQCVIHRDIKSENVLLDTDFTSKLCDFGVSKLVDRERTTQPTRVIGTKGYLAPEYMEQEKARKGTDMFSFGIMALEICCGRRPGESGALVRSVWRSYLAGFVVDAGDPRLKDYDEDEMRCLMTVGLWCSNLDYTGRPSAEQVVKVLKKELPVPELPRDMYPLPLPPLQIETSEIVEASG